MKKVKNNFKYKNIISPVAKLKKALISFFNYKFEDVVIAKYEIDLEAYKYLYRHLVKINRIFKGFMFLTISKAKYNGKFGYTVVINLKVIR